MVRPGKKPVPDLPDPDARREEDSDDSEYSDGIRSPSLRIRAFDAC